MSFLKLDQNLSTMDVTTFLAWLGAITGTSAFLWDVFKWRRSGARLRVGVMLDMTVEDGGYFREEFVPETPHIIARVVNEGQAATILESLQIVVYENRKKKRYNEEKARAVIFDTHLGKLPHTLNPANKWNGAIPQTPALYYSVENELVYLEIHHTLSRKPTIVRVKRHVAFEMFTPFLKEKVPIHTSWIGDETPLEPRYRIAAELMSSGDLWRVAVYDRTRSKHLKWLGAGWTHAENLTEEQAKAIAAELTEKVNRQTNSESAD
jgi:hypothetical protein